MGGNKAAQPGISKEQENRSRACSTPGTRSSNPWRAREPTGHDRRDLKMIPMLTTLLNSARSGFNKVDDLPQRQPRPKPSRRHAPDSA